MAIDLDSGANGYLVLADIWFPGWKCTVDGRPTPIYRANYLFRAIELPASGREVVFQFEAPSYETGKLISSLALGCVMGFTCLRGSARALCRAFQPLQEKECHALVS